jgi:predicted permease
MKTLRVIVARVKGIFTKHDADIALQEEMLAHLEMEIEDLIARGMNPDAARRQAMMASGGLMQAADAVRDQRGLPIIESTVADVRYALRALRLTPAFTAVAVLTLALGIGANTAIFSVVRGVLLKPLPHRNGDELMYLRQSVDGPDGANVAFSVPEVEDLRAGARSLGGIAEYAAFGVNLEREGRTDHLDVGLVTGNFFDVMGLSPVLGRLTRPTDDGTGVPAVMVLTHEAWLKFFAGDHAIIGKQVRVDGTSATVIGVLQPAPYFPDRVDVFLNMVVSPHHLSAQMVQNRSHRMTEVIARLAPGATVQQARNEVATVYARMQAAHPEAYAAARHYRAAVIPFKEAIGERARVTLWLLMAAAAFVMIISAANVTNLTLMRGVRREHELVIRAALGAGTRRLRRLLLVENLVLTFVGAALGIVIANGGLRLLIALAQRYSPRAAEIRLDTVVLAFTVTLSTVVALLLSYAASLPREGALAALISAAGRRISGSLRKQRLQRGLVVAQIAVSVVLLAGAGLLTRTMIRLSSVQTGLQTEEILTIPVPLINFTRPDFSKDAVHKEQYEQMRRELLAVPGVIDVGVGSTMPLRSSLLDLDMKAEGKDPATGEPTPHADFRTAGPEYFSASSIPVVKGRAFTAADRFGTPKVVILNQTLAKQFFGNHDPIGRRVALTGPILQFTPFSPEWRTVVGVVQDTHDGGLDADPRAALFAPFAQEVTLFGGVVIRADSNIAAITAQAERIVRKIAPTAPIENIRTVRQIKDESVAPRRLNAALISSFGILAVIIAAVGIAGVLAFSVSARTNEIGIRMSLGADRGRVQRMILSEGGELLAVGLTIGVIGALLAARLMTGMLFGVQAWDPVTFVVVAAAMAVIGLIACWIPALRAARVEPAVTMRA